MLDEDATRILARISGVSVITGASIIMGVGRVISRILKVGID